MSADDSPRLGSIGEYKLIEKLGEGGMGTVYKAWHTELERVVALKVLAAHRMSDPQAVARFRHEMKAVGRCDHPNIVRAHDAREIEGTYFLAMEYVDGFDLAELVARLGPLPVADACELIRRAALGLACAAGHGLVHRDIKPSNLMLSRDGELKILDLGLARLQAVQPVHEAMTAAGQVMGTPDYMAPEQATDSHGVDIRADIYSLGCTLYTLLAAQPPFGSKYHTAFEKIAAQLREPAPPIRKVRRDVPRQLADVLDRMLAKAPGDRFATPGDVADVLATFATGADLSGLLAKAASGARPVRGAAGTVPAGRAGALSATPSATGESTASVLRPWYLRRTAVGVVVLLAFSIGLCAFLVGRLASHDRQRETAETVIADDVAGENAVREDDMAAEETAGIGREAAPEIAIVPDQLPGWIVTSWTRPRMGRPGLWLIRPNGQQRAPLTDDPDVFDVQPSFSPDGRRIAFIRGRDLQSSNGVWVCNADGSELRQLVTPSSDSERFFSPVWGGDSLIYFARDSHVGRLPNMELWRVDLSGEKPQRVFAFQEAVGQAGGLATDVSPDGRQLAVIAQAPGQSATADVYVTDLGGKLVHAIWTDGLKDARPLWSPDGNRIAWCHYFTESTSGADVAYGVGFAEQGGDGHWATQIQPEHEGLTTPLAWSPDGRYLLCAQIQPGDELLPPATLFLMDSQFRMVETLFSLNVTTWRSSSRDFGRLADWALVPDDALPESLRDGR
jgi:hypothetical protein